MALKDTPICVVALAIRMLVVGDVAEGTVLNVEPAVMLKKRMVTGACPLLHVAVRSCFCPESMSVLVAIVSAMSYTFTKCLQVSIKGVL